MVRTNLIRTYFLKKVLKKSPKKDLFSKNTITIWFLQIQMAPVRNVCRRASLSKISNYYPVVVRIFELRNVMKIIIRFFASYIQIYMCITIRMFHMLFHFRIYLIFVYLIFFVVACVCAFTCMHIYISTHIYIDFFWFFFLW